MVLVLFVWAGSQSVNVILQVLPHFLCGQWFQGQFHSQGLCCAAWVCPTCTALGWAQGWLQSYTEQGVTTPAFPLHSLTCKSPFSRSSGQKHKVRSELKLPVLLPHYSAWSGVPLGKAEGVRVGGRGPNKQKHRDFPYTTYTPFRPQGPFSWFFWTEIQNVFQSFSSLWCHCGVLQPGHLGTGPGFKKEKYGK